MPKQLDKITLVTNLIFLFDKLHLPPFIVVPFKRYKRTYIEARNKRTEELSKIARENMKKFVDDTPDWVIDYLDCTGMCGED